MNESTKISLIKQLDVTELAGEKVMIDFETGKYFLLKGSANDIWELIQKDITIGEIKENLMDIYSIDEASCMEGILSFLSTLKEYEFIKAN